MFPRHSILKCANIVRRAVNQQSLLSVEMRLYAVVYLSIYTHAIQYTQCQQHIIHIWHFYTFIHVIISDILSWVGIITITNIIRSYKAACNSFNGSIFIQSHIYQTMLGVTISAMQCTYTFTAIGVRVRVLYNSKCWYLKQFFIIVHQRKQSFSLIHQMNSEISIWIKTLVPVFSIFFNIFSEQIIS